MVCFLFELLAVRSHAHLQQVVSIFFALIVHKVKLACSEILFCLSDSFPCSVRDEVTDISQVNYIARDTNRHQNAFDGAHFKHGAKNVLAKEKCLKNKNNLKKGNNACWSGKCVQKPTLLEPRLAHNLNHLSQEKIGQHGCWLFEEGYRSTDMNLDHSSVCQTSKTQRPSAGSRLFNEGTFGICLDPEPHIEVKFSFNRSKHGSPLKCSPHGSCISEKYAFCQSSCHKRYNVSSTLSNCELGAIAPDIFPESSDFELESRPPHSSQDADSEGEKLILELSSVRSISKCEENNSESQQANDDNIMPQSGLECKELKDATLETLSSAKISAKPDSSVGGRVCLMNSGLLSFKLVLSHNVFVINGRSTSLSDSAMIIKFLFFVKIGTKLIFDLYPSLFNLRSLKMDKLSFSFFALFELNTVSLVLIQNRN